MPVESRIEKLRLARDKLADVYKAEATDDLHDNGNLIDLHEAITHTESAIVALEKREE